MKIYPLTVLAMLLVSVGGCTVKGKSSGDYKLNPDSFKEPPLYVDQPKSSCDYAKQGVTSIKPVQVETSDTPNLFRVKFEAIIDALDPPLPKEYDRRFIEVYVQAVEQGKLLKDLLPVTPVSGVRYVKRDDKTFRIFNGTYLRPNESWFWYGAPSTGYQFVARMVFFHPCFDENSMHHDFPVTLKFP